MRVGIRNLRITLMMLLAVVTVLMVTDLSQVYAETLSPSKDLFVVSVAGNVV